MARFVVTFLAGKMAAGFAPAGTPTYSVYLQTAVDERYDSVWVSAKGEAVSATV